LREEGANGGDTAINSHAAAEASTQAIEAAGSGTRQEAPAPSIAAHSPLSPDKRAMPPAATKPNRRQFSMNIKRLASRASG